MSTKPSKRPFNEAMADLRKEKAAEQMYEALKAAKHRIEDALHERPHPYCGCTYCVIVAAIDKADGKP